ncbi:MAG: hypothetical protein HQK83_14260 [Fibrobacteria bacterium]|nr:hypothetical protein [Fibrobacteria bacterium]
MSVRFTPSNKIAPLLIAVFFLFPVYLQAQTDVFKHFSTSFEAGAIVPQYELQDVLEPQPIFGLRVNTPYYKSWLVHAQMRYALLDGSDSPRSLHYIKTGIGLGYQFSFFSQPVLGIGLSNYFVRASDIRTAQKFLLDDNESEFGVYPFLQVGFPLSTSFSLIAGFEWDMIFSEPRYSHLLNVNAGIEYRWW